jgi:hypothetical protein
MDALPVTEEVDKCEDAGVSDLLAHLVTKLLEVRSDECGGTQFAVSKLRVLVDVAPPPHHLRLDFLGLALNGIPNSFSP